MAKQTNNTTEAKPAVGPTARFQLKHPRAGWEGEVAGVKFVGGIGYTDSPLTAHGLMSRGIVPIDSQDKPEFRLDADALARIAKHAEEWPK